MADIGLMGHVVCGYPSLEASGQMIQVMIDEGVDWIEIQIPFSEPIADGPLFMVANQECVQAGITFEHACDLLETIKQKNPNCKTRFLVMTYYNVAMAPGTEVFISKVAASGFKGAIIPDLPPEHAADFDQLCQKNDFFRVPLVAPNTPDERLKTLLFGSTSFPIVYAVARAGVTGKKTEFSASLAEYLGRIRQRTRAQIALGFGIRTREDVDNIADKADIAVIGTEGLRVFLDKGLDGYREFWRKISAN